MTEHESVDLNEELPDRCPDCGGYVDHWTEAITHEAFRVGWVCQHCDSSDEMTISGQQKSLDEQDSQTLYVVIDPAPTDTGTRPHFSDDSIIGVYDTKQRAETAAESHGEYHYAADMEVGRYYPGVYIYEAPLNGEEST